jgi:hypothetical protein
MNKSKRNKSQQFLTYYGYARERSKNLINAECQLFTVQHGERRKRLRVRLGLRFRRQ